MIVKKGERSPTGAPIAGERRRIKVKQEKSVNLYMTHSLLLVSPNTPHSPLAEIPPVFCPRVSTGGESGTSDPKTRPILAERERYFSHDRYAPGLVALAPQSERYTTQQNANGDLLARCPMCGKERPCHGRRSKRIYCSDACRSKAWRRVHPSKAPQNVKRGPDE